MMEFLVRLQRVFDTVLFRIGDTPITLSTLLSVALVVILTFWASRVLRLLAERTLSRRGGRPGVIGTVTGIIHYAVLIVGFAVALSTAGIDLTALFAAGAIFAVAIGFAMQSISENFVAGVILLAERAIKPGDVLQVEGKVVKVAEMGIRASIGQTRDGEDLIIPNSTLIQTTVTNYTLRSPVFRVRVPVGVVYASDMALVRTTLRKTAESLDGPWYVKDREAQIVMTAFGDHSVNWELAVWINDPFEWRPAVSAIHEAIWWAFREHDIIIAFPQLDLHLDAPIMESIERMSRPAA